MKNFDNCEEDFSKESHDDENAHFDRFEKYAKAFVDNTLPIITDFYPQLRSKRAELRKLLLETGEDAFFAINDYKKYVFGKDGALHDPVEFHDIDFSGISLFVRHSALDSLADDFDQWYRKKIGYEYIYVDGFYAGVFVKQVHIVLKNSVHKFFPELNYLSPEQLDEIYCDLIFDSWSTYNKLALLDPNDINGSFNPFSMAVKECDDMVLNWNYLLELANTNDQEYILYFEPKPVKMPSMCLNCLNYCNKGPNLLCILYRLERKNSPDFTCMDHQSSSDIQHKQG